MQQWLRSPTALPPLLAAALPPPDGHPCVARSPAVPLPAPGGVPARSTTLWVGRIAPTVESEFVQQLLEACGPVREWKPVTEPDTGRLKGFGFVTFAEPEGVLVALQVLQDLKVDGQELALKCNKVRRHGGGVGMAAGCIAAGGRLHVPACMYLPPAADV